MENTTQTQPLTFNRTNIFESIISVLNILNPEKAFNLVEIENSNYEEELSEVSRIGIDDNHFMADLDKEIEYEIFKELIITEDGKPLFSHKMVIETSYELEKKDYLNLNELFELFTPLFSKHPYLINFLSELPKTVNPETKKIDKNEVIDFTLEELSNYSEPEQVATLQRVIDELRLRQ